MPQSRSPRPATRYNWRRGYGGVDTDAVKIPRSCASRTPLKRLLAEAETVQRCSAGGLEGDPDPSAKCRAGDMLTTTLGMSERLACKPLG
uniref:Uncharacterized protein n=1 Tax=Mycolicibacterium gilvum (strain PYR-GCK) TaxID=350054 RepID=A4TF41_MYCGI|nr:hypothetical protein Mflv_4761 [Mycolicibacterium gilvum PYR-GCK]